MRLEEAEVLYKEELDLRGLADTTVKFYLQTVRDIHKFMLQGYGDLPVDEITHPMLRAFMVCLKKKGAAPAYMNKHLAGVRAFFLFLEYEELVTTNVSLKLKWMKVRQTLPDVLTQEEVKLILMATVPKRTDFEMCRNQLFVEVFYATGARLSEIAGLHWRNVDFKNRRIKVLGKGNKERIIPYTERVGKAFEAYLEEWEREIALELRGYVFISIAPSRFGQRLSGDACVNVFANRAKASGIKKRVYPHLFRHTFATHMLENGAHLISVQKLLGHASYASTLRYEHVAMRNVLEDYEKCVPKLSMNQ